MAGRGVHFALTADQYTAACNCDTDSELIKLIQEGIEEDWDQEWLCETDKSWDAIHRSLTNGKLEWDNGSFPLNAAILGGLKLYQGENYIVTLATPEQVSLIARAFMNTDKLALRKGYDKIKQAEYDGKIGNDDFEYTWEYFRELVSLFSKASQSNRAMLFSVDQ